MSFDFRLRVLSEETLDFLEALAAASSNAWSEGGLTLTFTSANWHRNSFGYNDHWQKISKVSGKPFQSTISENDAQALATLLMYARGDFRPGQAPPLSDQETAIRLIGLLQRDLRATALSYVQEGDGGCLGGSIELIDEYHSYELSLWWSVD